MRHLLDDFTFGQLNAVVKKLGGQTGVEKVLSGEWIVGEPAKIAKRAAAASKKVLTGLLELYGEAVSVPANDHFVARDKFVIDRNGELPISYLGDNFKSNFLGVTELNVKAVTLKQRKLLKRSVDGPILSALGGVEKATIKLANVFEFLKTADRSKWFIFYIADTNWAVYAFWSDHGWDVEALSVTSPCEWFGGGLVVSR